MRKNYTKKVRMGLLNVGLKLEKLTTLCIVEVGGIENDYPTGAVSSADL